jgi:hypothetical protein
MKSTNVWAFVFAATAAAVTGSAAHAQVGYRPSASSPAYSPYLNLTRPGNLANNYFGLVRPQIDAQNSINSLQQQYSTLNQAVMNPTATDQQYAPPTTGHAATFMNYGHYFPGIGTGARPMTAGGGMRPPTTAAAAPSTGRR